MGAPKPHNRKTRNSPTRRRLAFVGVAIFLLVDVGLVALAVTASKPVSSAGTVATAPTTTPPSVDPDMTADLPVVEPVETTVTATVVPTRILAALDEATAWRATTGGCPTMSAVPERTTDSGATWESFNASTGTEASSILAINVVDAAAMSLVTLDNATCAPQVVSTFVAGAAWKAYPERAAAEWYIDPATPAIVHTPGGNVPAPCAAVATLAPTDDANVAVLCVDASIFTTQNAGSSWSAPVSVPGAAALAATAEGYQAAVANSVGCVGVSLLSVSLEATLDAAAGTCVAATVGAGETALSTSPEGMLWLWAGDAFARSADGGVTWG